MNDTNSLKNEIASMAIATLKDSIDHDCRMSIGQEGIDILERDIKRGVSEILSAHGLL